MTIVRHTNLHHTRKQTPKQASINQKPENITTNIIVCINSRGTIILKKISYNTLILNVATNSIQKDVYVHYK